MATAPVSELFHRQPERLVLAIGISLGLVLAFVTLLTFDHGVERDFQAYYVAAEFATQGRPFEGSAIQGDRLLSGKSYVYLPITVVVFLVYAAFPTWNGAYVLQVAVLLVALGFIGRYCITVIEAGGRSLSNLDRWLIVGFCVASVPAVGAVVRGNIDPVIVLLLLVGFISLENRRGSITGITWAIAATFKLFPALLGIWLVYRRAHRAVLVAIGVGVGAIAASIAVFGVSRNQTVLEYVLFERTHSGAFAGGLDPDMRLVTLRRPLSQLIDAPGIVLTAIAVAIVIPVVWLMYRNVETRRDRLAAFGGTYLAILVATVPMTAGYAVYLLFPLVPLAYLVVDPMAKRLLLASLVLSNMGIYPQHVESAVAFVPLHDAVATRVVSVTTMILSFTSVLLVAFLLGLAGCALAVVRDDP